MTGEPDRWAQWLFAGRDAGDPRQRALVLEHLVPEPPDRFWGYDVRAVSELADTVKAAFAELADPAAAVMRDFDDRDLVSLAEEAGFERIHLECRVDVEPGSQLRVVGLDALLDSAPNPLVPSLRDAIASALSPSEREVFLAHLERAIAEQRPLRRSAVAYLVAVKPG